MKRIIALLLVTAISIVALHDYYVDQFDNTTKKELVSKQVHHIDFHKPLIVPRPIWLNGDGRSFVRFSFRTSVLQTVHQIEDPPPRFAV